MIYDDLSKIVEYKGISKNLDKAIDFIIAGEYKKGNFGKNIIQGEEIFYNYPENPTTKDEKDGFLETHKRYIDIHVIIDGRENIGYIQRENVKEKGNYNEEGDFVELSGVIEQKIPMDKSKFLMLFPGEPHMALMKAGENSEVVNKVIFKVEK